MEVAGRGMGDLEKNLNYEISCIVTGFLFCYNNTIHIGLKRNFSGINTGFKGE